MRLTFDPKKIAELLADGERCWKEKEPQPLYGNKTGPGLWLVGDDGVYFMHNGEGHRQRADRKPGETKLDVVYAENCDPTTMEFDAWWANKGATFGNDDGVEFFSVDDIRKWIDGAAKVAINFRGSSMSLMSIPATPKSPKRRAAHHG